MEKQWIKDAANTYQNLLRERRQQAAIKSIEEQKELALVNQIAAEGPAAGLKLWGALEIEIESDIDDFNLAIGATVLRKKSLADGTFEVNFVEQSNGEKVAVLAYAPDTYTFSWHIVGGSKGVPLTVGIDPKSPEYGMQFGSDSYYYSVAEISRRVIMSLQP
jgi:hypothetical protein